MDKIDWLVKIYNAWLDKNNIQDRASADALLMGYPLTDSQQQWIKKFINTWKKQNG